VMILGPLTAAETAVVGSAAEGTPVLAFTSDTAAAAPGVWTLGLTPRQQVHRLVTAIHDDGRGHIAAILPDGPFGDALAQGLNEATADTGMAPPTIRRLSDEPGSFDNAIAELSDATARHQAVKDRIASLKTGASAEDAAQPTAPPPFDALLLAEPPATLDPVLRSLPGYDVVMPGVRLVGPAFWSGQAAGHPRLSGAWYAAPDPSALHIFNEAYTAKFGTIPPALASLAFDAAAIARVLATQGDISSTSLTRSEGFTGAEGLLQLMPDGHVRRALAIFQSRAEGDRIVSPAPDSLN